MPSVITRNIIAIGLLAAALACLGAGAVVTHKVYDAGTADFGIVAFTRISEGQLVIDTTFGGAERKGEKLYSTYDRSQVRGKRSCPT
jgi:hypothetical protein